MEVYETRKAALTAKMQAKERGEKVVIRQTYIGRRSRNSFGPREKMYLYRVEPPDVVPSGHKERQP